MDRLLTIDKEQYIQRMQAEMRGVLERVADAVNDAPTGNVISGSEMQVRDLMGEFRRKVFDFGELPSGLSLRVVLAASAEEQLELDWSAAQCKTATPAGQEVSRL